MEPEKTAGPLTRGAVEFCCINNVETPLLRELTEAELGAVGEIQSRLFVLSNEAAHICEAVVLNGLPLNLGTIRFLSRSALGISTIVDRLERASFKLKAQRERANITRDKDTNY